MRANGLGIMLRKPELAALLAYAGDTTSNNVVKFRVGNSGQLIASATDGKRALEGRGVAESGVEAGEWAIERTTMEACRRILDDGDTVVCLKVTPKGCKKFQILGAASGDVQGTYEIPAGEVSTQVSMDAIHDLITGDQGASLLEGSWFAVNPGYLSDLHIVSKAADKCPVSIYPPRDPLAPVRFEARSSEGHWRGVIMPVPVVAPGDEAAEPEDGSERPPGSPEQAGPLKLEPELSTQKKRRPKATAPTKKKAAKKPKRGAAAAATDAEEPDEATAGDDGVVEDDYDPNAPKAKAAKGKEAKH